MDPLSITTALLTFLTASGSCVANFRRLVSQFKSAPAEILAISNEISDLSIIVHDIEMTRREIHLTTVESSEFDDVLRKQIVGAEAIIASLTSIVEEVFSQSADGRQKFDRQKWLLKRSKVVSLKHDLLDIKRRIGLLLTSSSASRAARIEVSLERLHTEIPSANRTRIQTADFTTNPELNATLVAQHQRIATSPRNSEPDNLMSEGLAQDLERSFDVSSPKLSTFLDMVRQVGQFAAITFHVHRLAKCEGDCECHCHARTLYRSPQLIDRVFGALFVGYAGLPIFTADCNVPNCSNQYSRVMQLSYTFPSWFLAKTVDVVAAITYTNEPSFGLKVRNRINWMGSNSIFQLARNGDTAGIIELFKRRKASPNDLAAASGQSPLHFALELGHIETCKFLLDIGVDPYLKTDDGYSDAHEISSLILSKGGARQAQKARQYEPLFQKFAQLHSELWDFTYIQRVVVGEVSAALSTILENPVYRAEINHKDLHGRTALFWAALRGDRKKVRLLLHAGADAKLVDREGRIPLHAALISGDIRCTELLLIAGDANTVHVRDRYGDAALQIATWAKDDPELLETLFLAGASLDCVNNNGSTALTHAACLNHAENGKYLLARGADPNCVDKDDDTPLSETIRFGNIAMMKVLLENGARCDTLNKSRQNLLHIAALYATEATIQALSAYMPMQLMSQSLDAQGWTARDAFESRIAKESGLQQAFNRLITLVDENNSMDSEVFVDAVEVME